MKEEELRAEIIYRPMIYHCTTNKPFVWLLLVYGFKGILLIFGLFLAWETRKVKIATLNDSRYIGKYSLLCQIHSADISAAAMH